MSRRIGPLLLAVAGSGVPAALVWWWLGSPSQWIATDRGLVLTEQNATGQFQVVAVFTLIGVVVGLACGIAVERRARPARWQTVVALMLASLAAALVCWWLGVVLGPPDPESVTGVKTGSRVPAQFAVDAIPPFVVWPLSALIGYALSLYLSRDPDSDDLLTGDVASGPTNSPAQ